MLYICVDSFIHLLTHGNTYTHTVEDKNREIKTQIVGIEAQESIWLGLQRIYFPKTGKSV